MLTQKDSLAFQLAMTAIWSVQKSVAGSAEREREKIWRFRVILIVRVLFASSLGSTRRVCASDEEQEVAKNSLIEIDTGTWNISLFFFGFV